MKNEANDTVGPTIHQRHLDRATSSRQRFGSGGREIAFHLSTRNPARLHPLVLSAVSIVKPSLQGGLAFSRRFAEDQILHADVLVQQRPVDSPSSSDQSPVLPFPRSSVTETRVPRQRSGNGATV